MDESGAGFVHGRDQQHRHLEAISRRYRAYRADLRRIQSAHLHFMFAHRTAHLDTSHGRFKSAIGRHRPKQVESVRLVQLQRAHPEFLTLFKKPTIRYSDQTDRNRSGPSFPSGHMTNNTVIATCLTVFYRRRGALYWIITVALDIREFIWARIGRAI